MDIATAARRIKEGKLVAFPTETVYGLGANAFDARAVRKIYAAKGRPEDNPCIVHIADEGQLAKVAVTVPPLARKLMRRFWPGPLTLILKRHPDLPGEVTAGLDTVAVRMPSHPMALELIRQAGVPIAAPSANRSGRPSPTTAEHVAADFPRIPVLDGGPCEHGLESTVVLVSSRPAILRVGAIPLERIRLVAPNIRVSAEERERSPGTRHVHYAPAVPLTLFRRSRIAAMQDYVKGRPNAAVLCKDQFATLFLGNRTVLLGKTDKEMGQNLFSALRTTGATELIVLGTIRRGTGRAIMDRLERAAKKIF